LAHREKAKIAERDEMRVIEVRSNPVIGIALKKAAARKGRRAKVTWPEAA
jgi:hypothetical protein